MGRESAASHQSRFTAAAVKVKIGSLEAWALIDSGADFSMVKCGLHQRIKVELGCKSTTPSRSAKGAGGSPLVITEVLCDVPISISGETFGCSRLAAVAGLVYDVILGRDFCCQHRTIIDDEEGIFCIKGLKISLPTYPEIRASRAKVVLAETVTVPGRSILTAAAVVEPLDGSGVAAAETPMTGMVEPSPAADWDSLLIPRAVVAVASDGTVPIQFSNVGTEDVRLLKGSDVGTFFSMGDSLGDMCELCPEPDDVVDAVASCEGGGFPPEAAEYIDPDVKQALEPGLTDLGEHGQGRLRGLFEKYADVFSWRPGDIGQTNLTRHKIDTGDASPIKQRPRRVPLKVRDQVEKQKEKMLQDGIIEESESPWCSPVVLVRKKDGTFRFCVDLRAVNRVTKGFAMPLPRIDDSLDTLAKARWFTTLDMATGYWQVELAPEDREKTAFSTGKGLHHFRVMAMGLKNASGTFQKLMEMILAGLDTKSCLVYLDDVILFNRTEDEHLATLQEVFERIRAAGLKLKAQKCRFARKEVTFLGHLVSEEGIRPDPRNVEKVLAWPHPSSDEEMRSFLGLCGYYARFIQGYAAITKPLRDATVADGQIRWTEAMRGAFEQLKSVLATPPILTLPTGKGTFVLYTDACNFAVGVVLTEKTGEYERVVAYESKALSKQQMKWPTYDKELWAVVHGIRHFRQYTVGAKFEVVTDHEPLANIPDSISVERDGTGRRGRWAVELSSFDFRVRIRSGVRHGNADALSRRPSGVSVDEGNGGLARDAGMSRAVGGSVPTAGGSPTSSRSTAASPTGNAAISGVGGSPYSVITSVAPATLSSGPTDRVNPATKTLTPPSAVGEKRSTESLLLEAQQDDPTLSALCRAKEEGRMPKSTETSGWAVLKKHWGQVEVRSGVLGIASKQRFQAAVPKTIRAEIIRLAHDDKSSGHMGRRRTIARVKARFVWPGMNEDVRSYCASCTQCQRRCRPAPSRRAPLVTEVTSRPFERVAMDITEMPLSSKGNKYALVIMDYFSKYVRIYPMPNQKTETVMDAFLDWVQELGVPERLHTDQGAQFESLMMKEMYTRLGIHKTRTTPYHPQSDGMVERFMRTLKDMVSKYVDGQGLSWDEGVMSYAMAYNSSLHETTGYTPFYLIHGFEPRVPLDVVYGPETDPIPTRTFLNSRLKTMKRAYARVKEATSKAAARMAVRHDSRVNHTAYPTGTKVWVRDHTASVGGKPKLGLPYKGPVTIIGNRGGRDETTYKIQDERGKVRQVHYNDLKEFVPRVSGIQEGTTKRHTQGPGMTKEMTQEHGTGIREWIPNEDHTTGLQVPFMSFVRAGGSAGGTHREQQGGTPQGYYIMRTGRVSRPPAYYQAGR